VDRLHFGLHFRYLMEHAKQVPSVRCDREIAMETEKQSDILVMAADLIGDCDGGGGDWSTGFDTARCGQATHRMS
jgi:hypothetical protein